MHKLFIALFLLALFIAIPIHAVEKADEQHLDEVAERGSHVMSHLIMPSISKSSSWQFTSDWILS